MNMKNRDGVQDKPERTGTGERGRGKCAAVALFDGSERRLCINILPGLLRHPLMEAAHNVTDIGGGEINK